MIALGLTLVGDAPHPCVATPCDGLALICAPESETGDARARMRLQVACLRHFATFLPFAPANVITQEAALRWSHGRQDRMADTLSRLRETCQLSLVARPLAVPAGQPRSGAEWLRARAETVRARAEGLTRLRTTLERISAEAPPLERSETTQGAQLRLHLLLSTHRLDDALSAHRRGLAPLTQGATAWDITVTGPWPPYDFVHWDVAA